MPSSIKAIFAPFRAVSFFSWCCSSGFSVQTQTQIKPALREVVTKVKDPLYWRLGVFSLSHAFYVVCLTGSCGSFLLLPLLEFHSKQSRRPSTVIKTCNRPQHEALGITTEFVGLSQSLVLRSVMLDWIYIYRNWSINGNDNANANIDANVNVNANVKC